MATRQFGQALPRIEDDKFLRGEGSYLDDIDDSGALHVVFLRSPVAHGRILSLDTSRALEVPGIRGVYTVADLGALGRPLPPVSPHPSLTLAKAPYPLANGEVRFVGEPIAAVVADDRYVAEDAADLLELEIEQLPLVADLESAALPGSPLVHTDLPGNRGAVCTQRVGDPESVFAGADVVIRRRVTVERSAGMPLETRGVMARYDPSLDSLVIFDSTQAPTTVRAQLAELLDMPADRIRVVAPDTGGGFGTKVMLLYPEEVVVPFLARRLSCAVKWVEDRAEHFVASAHERKQIHEIELAATREGIVLGLRDVFLHDCGAYLHYGLDVPAVAAAQIAGPYRIPTIEVTFEAICTNTVPVTPYRGCGRPQACAALEIAMDALADALDLDRMELRRRNLISAGEFPYTRDGLLFVDGETVVMDSGDYHACLDQVLDALDYKGFRKAQKQALSKGRYLGFGLAVYVEATGLGPYEGARIEVSPADGAIRLWAGVATQGQSHATTLAQIAADRFGVDPGQVTVVTGDTGGFGEGIGTFASRSAVMAGNAVDMAAADLRDKILILASKMLEADPADLELRDGEVAARGAPSRRLSLRDIAAAADPVANTTDSRDPAGRDLGPPSDPSGPVLASQERGLAARAFFSTPRATWAGGVHGAIIEFDPGTWEPRWLRYVCSHDCGMMINPAVVEGQVTGGIAQGVGGAHLERICYSEDGQLQNASFMEFLMPFATEVPRIDLFHVVTPSALNPLGIKGVGEAGAIPVPAVFVSAARDALRPLGVDVSEAPLTPARIFELVEAAAGHAEP
jgi:carbon-monoxide dehydrogenase large subunit